MYNGEIGNFEVGSNFGILHWNG